MGLFDNPLEHCEKNAQWETVTDAVHPNDLVRCKRSDVEDLQAENIRLTAQVEELKTENQRLKDDLSMVDRGTP